MGPESTKLSFETCPRDSVARRIDSKQPKGSTTPKKQQQIRKALPKLGARFAIDCPAKAGPASKFSSSLQGAHEHGACLAARWFLPFR